MKNNQTTPEPQTEVKHYYDIHVHHDSKNSFSVAVQSLHKLSREEAIKLAVDRNRIDSDDAANVDNVTEVSKEDYEAIEGVEVKHTPLPYKVVIVENAVEILGAITPEGSSQYLATVWGNRDIKKLNATFIVKACNNHYTLLEALKEITDMACTWSTKGMTPTIFKALQAIKQAE